MFSEYLRWYGALTAGVMALAGVPAFAVESSVGIADRDDMMKSRPWMVEILDTHEGTHSAGFKIASADVSAALATNLRWQLDGTARTSSCRPPRRAVPGSS